MDQNGAVGVWSSPEERRRAVMEPFTHLLVERETFKIKFKNKEEEEEEK